MRVLAFLELVDPQMKRPVADQLDVFPADHFAAARVKFGVAWRDIDDLRRIEADCLRNHGAPSFAERTLNHAEVCAGRAGADDERIWKLQAVDSSGECWHIKNGFGKQLPCERHREFPANDWPGRRFD